MDSNIKIILITGASTGIGFETALYLAKEGHRVYATMRDVSKAESLKQEAENRGILLDVLMLDVQDEKSIASCEIGRAHV